MRSDGSITINTKIDQSGFKNGRKAIESGLSEIKSSLKGLASAVGIAFGAAAVVNFGKESVKTANELSNAMQGLQSIVEGQGRSFSKAQSFINDYVSDGLVPLANATTAYKNLAARGYSDDQIQKVMTALKDSAAFGRQANYSLGDAVTSATEGLKNENSILVDNAGVTKNVAKMWEDYAKSIGTTSNKLTQEQKIQAEVNGILTETRFQTGDAAKIAGTYTGQVAKLSYHFTELKTAIGNSIIPILQAIMPYVDSAVQGLTKLFNTFGQVVSSIFGVETTQMATNTEKNAKAQEKLAAATDNVTDSTKKSTKSAKDNLAAFDKLNVRQKDTSGSDSSAGTSGGTDTSTNNEKIKTEQIKPNVNSTFGKIKSAISTAYKDWGINNLIEQIQRGFNSIDFSAVKKNFQSIFSSLKVIAFGTFDGIKNVVKAKLDAIGSFIGGIVSVWGKWFETVSLGIAKFFENNEPKIIDSINTITGNLANGYTNLSLFFNTIFGTIGESIDRMREPVSDAIANLLGGFTTFALSIGEIASGAFSIWTENLAGWAEENAGKIGDTFDSFQQLGADLMNLWGDVFGDIGESLSTWWNDEMSPVWDQICEAVLGVADTVMNIWNKWIYPVISRVIEWAHKMWDDNLKGVFEAVLSFVSKVGDCISSVWNKFLKPVVDWCIDFVKPMILNVVNAILGVVSTVVGVVSGVVKGILKHLGGLLDFITGIFTLDFKKAWRGIKDFFGGIWDGIWSIAKGAINLIIDGINILWTGIYNTVSAIVNGIGGIAGAIGSVFGQDWSFKMPEKAPLIPKLATGAVIPPNSEFLAVLGDQKSGRNLEAPESLIRKIVREESGNGDNTAVVAAIENLTNVLINKKFFSSKEQFAREITPALNAESKRRGSSFVAGFC